MPSPRFPIPQGTLDMLILQILSLGPAHGYGIAQRLEQISRSVVQVNQGSLYPALHRLEQKGWLRAEWKESETGREAKFYSLTAAGRAEAETSSGKSAPWESSGIGGPKMNALPKAGMALAQAAAQVGRSGSPEQVAQAVTVLEEARRKLYSILAQD